MKRSRKKMALYEVINKQQHNHSYRKKLEKLRPDEPDVEKPVEQEQTKRLPYRLDQSKPVQFNAGRLEISLPYPLAIAGVMAIVLLVLVFFRLGQISIINSRQRANPAGQTGKTGQSQVQQNKTNVLQPILSAKTKVGNAEKSEAAKTQAGNRIVIQTYQLSSQLEPVKEYFAGYGIETEIKKIGSWYYLVTKKQYENPQKKGTDGYKAKEKIIELGADYQAPAGYETFGSKPFHDAYGKKFSD